MLKSIEFVDNGNRDVSKDRFYAKKILGWGTDINDKFNITYSYSGKHLFTCFDENIFIESD